MTPTISVPIMTMVVVSNSMVSAAAGALGDGHHDDVSAARERVFFRAESYEIKCAEVAGVRG